MVFEARQMITDYLGVLSQLRLFDRVDFEAIQHLLMECSVMRLKSEQVLIKKDEENFSIYVLIEGRLRVYLDDDTPAIAIIESGETVGELSVLDKRPASANVIADKDSILLEFSDILLWLMVHASHDFGRNLLILLSERLRGVNSMVDKSMRLQREYAIHATIDPLTGLYNRRWLNDALALEMTRCLSQGLPFGIMMLDIDHFKKYNDEYGHLAGDVVLETVAETLRVLIRKVDMAVRFGGEELLVLLPGADLEQSSQLAEQVREVISSKQMVNQDQHVLPCITVSIGVTTMHGKETSRSLLNRADEAMYQAKENGRNQTVFSQAKGNSA